MAKISSYDNAIVPKLSDKLIGTSVGYDVVEDLDDVTYNFTLGQLLGLFLPGVSYTSIAPISINSSNRVISIPLATNTVDGYLSAVDRADFNNKQSPLLGSGIVKSSGGTITYITGTNSQFLKADGSIDSTTYAVDSNVVHITGTETITGSKVFSLDSSFNGIKTGKGNNAIGSNTVVAVNGLALNSTGFNNVAIGTLSLSANTTGNNNSANGFNALKLNVIGNGNAANGSQSLENNVSDFNTAIGSQSLRLNTTGSKNSSFGYQSMYNNTTGINNVSVGALALVSNIVGNQNVGIGVEAGRYVSNGNSNYNSNNSIFIGQDTRPNSINQQNQIVIGYQAIGAGSNTVVLGNTSITATTLSGNVTTNGQVTALRLIAYGAGGVTSNTAVGLNALNSNTTGDNNTANGIQALYSNTTGNSNTANGVNALYSNTTGGQNTANGIQALYSNTTGNNNTANGVNSLFFNTTGNSNTANGLNAGIYIADGVTANTTPNNSVFLGDNTKALTASNTNQIVIGSGAIGAGSNTIVLGNNNIVTTALKGQIAIGITSPVASAKVQIDSFVSGFLPPRMTNAQRIAIASPAIGLMVYCTDAVEGVYVNKSTGWTFIG